MADQESKVRIVVEVSDAELNDLVRSLGLLEQEAGASGKAVRSLSKDAIALSKGEAGASAATKSMNTNLTGATKNQQGWKTALDDSNGSLARSRYALYDVAQTYGAISAALLGVSILAIKVGADFEKAFTQVERTTLTSSGALVGNIDQIRESLVNLSTEMPVAFDELSSIASVGAQIGLPTESLAKFTEVVAKFSAITGVSVESAALSFASLAAVTGVAAEDYDKLGSAIALVGVNSRATEDQILSVSKEISNLTSKAGFSTEEVIGLAGAMASLNIAPERARGTLGLYFGALNTAIAEGGTAMAKFSTIAGISSEKIEQLVRSGKGGEEIFSGFLKGLGDLDNVQVTQALDDLDLSQLRAADSLGRLASQQKIYNSTQADAQKGFTEGIFLDQAYALILDDLNSQWKILINSLNALVEELTGGLVPGLAGAIGLLSQFVNWMREIGESTTAQVISRTALALSVMAGTLIAFKAIAALATASTYALVTANTALAAQGTSLGLWGLVKTMFQFGNYSRNAAVQSRAAASGVGVLGATSATASVGVSRLSGALLGLGRATVVFGILQLAISLVSDFRGTILNLLGPLNAVAEVGYKVYDSIIGVMRAVSQAMGVFGGFVSSGADNFEKFTQAGRNNLAAMNKWANSLPQASKAASGLENASYDLSDSLTNVADTSAGASSGIDDVGGAAAGAAAEVRTLVDYASDLSGVFSRAFDIRYGSQSSMDSVTSAWRDLNDEMDDYRRKTRELSADRKVKQYFLSVAEAYGDTLRAGVLRSELEGIDKDLAVATAGVSTELKGNSVAAVENRKRVTDLVSGYEDYIVKLAESGATQSELTTAVARSKASFLAQGVALGYSAAQLKPYVAGFDDMIKIIARVPRNITVSANTDPALQALAEFAARATAQAGKTYSGGTITAPRISGGSALSWSEWTKAHVQGISASASASAWNTYLANARWRYNQYASGFRGYASGGSVGYTGNGGKYEPKGVVHGGEFVFTKEATQKAGVGNLYGMMNAFERGRGMYSGGAVTPTVNRGGGGGSSGPQIVHLSPEDRSLLARAGDIRLYLDGRQVAQSGWNNTVSAARRESN